MSSTASSAATASTLTTICWAIRTYPAVSRLPIGPSTAPTGHLVWQQPQHSSVMTNSVRRMTDTDVTLYPQSTFSVHFGYSQNIMQGPSLLPVRSGGVIKYNSLMELYQRHSTDEYSMAIDWKPVKGTTVTYEQRIHHYKENSYITLDPNGFQVQEADGTPAYLGNWDFSSNASTSTTTTYAPYSTAACSSNSIASATTFLYPSSNGGAPIIDPSCSVVTGYLRTYPIRTTMPSEIVRFQSTSIKNLIMNGQFSYSKMNMNMPSFMDNAWGLLAGTATAGATRDEYNSAVGSGKREVYNAEYGVIWEVAKNFDLEDQVTLSANGQPGNVNTSGYTKLVTGYRGRTGNHQLLGHAHFECDQLRHRDGRDVRSRQHLLRQRAIGEQPDGQLDGDAQGQPLPSPTVTAIATSA